jgi:hypothetical protein
MKEGCEVKAIACLGFLLLSAGACMAFQCPIGRGDLFAVTAWRAERSDDFFTRTVATLENITAATLPPGIGRLFVEHGVSPDVAVAGMVIIDRSVAPEEKYTIVVRVSNGSFLIGADQAVVRLHACMQMMPAAEDDTGPHAPKPPSETS